jgi:uncharacterized delta-60 repeat protein
VRSQLLPVRNLVAALFKSVIVCALGCGARTQLDGATPLPDGGQAVADFDFTITPSSILLTQGGAPVSVNVHVTRGPGIASAVSMDLVSAPNGISAPSVIVPADGTDSTLALQASLSAPQGGLNGVLVRGTSGSTTKTKPIAIFVRGCPGCLDTTFTTTGYWSIDNAYATAIKVDAVGAVFLAGSRASFNTYPDPGLIVKIDAKGMLDSSFGAGGIVEIYRSSEQVYLNAIDLTPTAEAIVCGYAQSSDLKSYALLAKTTPQGVLDTSFGTAGISVPNVGTPGECGAVRLDGDGHVIASGSVEAQGSFLFELQASGDFAPDFGDAGVAPLPWGPYAPAAAIDLVDGGIVAGGLNGSTTKSNGALIVRTTSSGALVPTFGDAGIASLPCFAVRDLHAAAELVVACDAVAKTTLDGSIVSSFGDAGLAHPSTGSAIGVRRLFVQDDGRIVALGSAAVAKGAVIVRLTATGALDPTFGIAGVASLIDDQADLVADVPLGVSPYPDERAVVTFTGVSSPPGKWVAYIARVWL